jgi:LPXTG-motif cell wall-anchored protein
VLLSGALVTGTAMTALAQAQTFNVNLGAFVIVGAPPMVRAGTPITFNARNLGPAGDTTTSSTHNLSIEGPGGTIPSTVPNLTGGQTATIRFAALQPGTYTLYCPVAAHRSLGMAATFTAVAGAVALPATGGVMVPAGVAAAGLAVGVAGFVLRRRR